MKLIYSLLKGNVFENKYENYIKLICGSMIQGILEGIIIFNLNFLRIPLRACVTLILYNKVEICEISSKEETIVSLLSKFLLMQMILKSSDFWPMDNVIGSVGKFEIQKIILLERYNSLV